MTMGAAGVALVIMATLAARCVALLVGWERDQREIARLRAAVRRCAYLEEYPPIW